MAELVKSREQLKLVEELLQEEPNNEELLGLARELREAISYAEALSGGGGANGADSGPASTGWTTTTKSSSSSTSSSAKANAQATAPREGGDFLPGQRCEVKTKECKRWQGAIVLKRLPDYEYVVQRLHDSKEMTVKGTEDEIREIGPPATLRHDALIPGLKIRARYSGDGKYYQATVDKRTDQGCLVRFEGYEDDEPEHVALEHVRLETQGEAPSLLEQIEIPKHLIVNPDDSEELKQKKLRQQKALRKRVRAETIEQVHSQKQGNWLAFQATTKRVKGAMTSVGAASQFSLGRNDPEARLGVVKPSAPSSAKD